EGIVRIRQLQGDRQMPLLIGGSGAASIDVAARYADEWNMTTASAETFAGCTAQLDAQCREVGRDPRTIQRSVAAGVLIGRDRQDLHERSVRLQSIVQPFAGVAPEHVPSVARAQGWVAGTPEEVVRTLHALAHAGVDRVMLGVYDFDDVAMLALIAD